MAASREQCGSSHSSIPHVGRHLNQPPRSFAAAIPSKLGVSRWHAKRPRQENPKNAAPPCVESIPNLVPEARLRAAHAPVGARTVGTISLSRPSASREGGHAAVSAKCLDFERGKMSRKAKSPRPKRTGWGGQTGAFHRPENERQAGQEERVLRRESFQLVNQTSRPKRSTRK